MNRNWLIPPGKSEVARIVSLALLEDVGPGDISTLSTVEASVVAEGLYIAKQPGVLCGLPLVREVFAQIDRDVMVDAVKADGDLFEKGDVLVRISGNARSLLTGERVSLNFMQRLSGISSMSMQYVQAVASTKAQICDTRKTTPGLRNLEKYAVRTGGASNHRMALYDAVMIKDNHIVAAGSITAAVQRAKTQIPHTMTIEVECDTFDQVTEALNAKADIIMLDNMSLPQMKACVAFVNGRCRLEASGGVNLKSVKAIADTGVDLISVGALTHSAVACDIGLDLRIAE